MVFYQLPEPNPNRIPRWYFGGFAATFSQIFIQPIDVIKVGLETEEVMEKLTSRSYCKYIITTRGLLGLYSGLLASMRQQFIYSITRFGIHQKIKQHNANRDIPFIMEVGITALSGAIGGFLKTPIEIVNVRMQIDLKLPPHKRYNYKNIRHGLELIYMMDGYRPLFAGATLTVIRSVALTVSQICIYDRTKSFLVTNHGFTDSIGTYIIASVVAGFLATLLCQPVDVMKVRYMSRTDEFQGIWQVFKKQIRLGKTGFYRGTLLSFIKIETQTIITFVLMEKMRLYYGVEPHTCEGNEKKGFFDFTPLCIPKKKEPPVTIEEKKGMLRSIVSKIFTLIPSRRQTGVIEKVEEIVQEETDIVKEEAEIIKTDIDETIEKAEKSKLAKFLRRIFRLVKPKIQTDSVEQDIVKEGTDTADVDESAPTNEDTDKITEEENQQEIRDYTLPSE